MALAAGSYDLSGSTVGKSTATYVPMSETRIFVDQKVTYTMPDNGTPTAGAVGDCFGYIEIAAGQGATGSGTCVWTIASGDKWFGPWLVNGMTADGTSQGTWYVAGGTGTFAGATGGGTFTAQTNPETGASKLDVAGSMVVK
jgi:hypothetical protein